jgi:hypothetical protein
MWVRVGTAGGGSGAGAALTTLAHRTLHVLRTLDDVQHHHPPPSASPSGGDALSPAWAAEGARALVTACLTDGGCGAGAAAVWDDARVSAACPPVPALTHVLLRWATEDRVTLDAASGCRLLAALAATLRAGAAAVTSATAAAVPSSPSPRSPAAARRTNPPAVRGCASRVHVLSRRARHTCCELSLQLCSSLPMLAYFVSVCECVCECVCVGVFSRRRKRIWCWHWDCYWWMRPAAGPSYWRRCCRRTLASWISGRALPPPPLAPPRTTPGTLRSPPSPPSPPPPPSSSSVQASARSDRISPPPGRLAGCKKAVGLIRILRLPKSDVGHEGNFFQATTMKTPPAAFARRWRQPRHCWWPGCTARTASSAMPPCAVGVAPSPLCRSRRTTTRTAWCGRCIA